MRRVLVAALALLLGVQVVRNAAVTAVAATAPQRAARLWPAHPAIELGVGMTAIARSTRDGKPVPSAALQMIWAAATKDPLSPEPFLVRGVEAQLAGDQRVAVQAFLGARWRDPRSLPARYFLAGAYFGGGDAAKGLTEIATLARLVPTGVGGLAPYVASYARDRSNWPQLRALFRSDPGIADGTFSVLSADAANADLILALADRRSLKADTSWVQNLLGAVVAAGEPRKARQIWADLSHVHSQELLFDPTFVRGDVPPPFNWRMASSTVGLAERRPGGGLHAIFYGQEDGVLASQLLLLPPGTYRLSIRASGDLSAAGALQWRLICSATSAPIASTGFAAAAARGWSFAVPPTCEAQSLELAGTSADIPRQVDVTVLEVKLSRDQPNG
jgi:hypothetical protein